VSFLYAQWLPILLSSIAVFIASSLVHMVVGWHRNDQSKLPNEDAVADVLRGTPVGDYRLPFPDSAAGMKDPKWQEKVQRGPLAMVTVSGFDMKTGFQKSLAQWFVYSLIVSWVSAHIAAGALHTGASHALVFHTVAITAFMGYGMALAQKPIWDGKPWGPTLKSMVDALVYGAITGVIFAWRWPN
jgi:hypothetical protein